ncbi:MAG: FapA family protein [Cellvibrionaceae bacterium]
MTEPTPSDEEKEKAPISSQENTEGKNAAPAQNQSTTNESQSTPENPLPKEAAKKDVDKDSTEQPESPKPPPFCSLKFTYNEPKLTAELIPNTSEVELTESSLTDQINQNGFDELFLIKQNIKRLLQKTKSNRDFSLVIAEKRDGAAEIKISSDKMSATLTLAPSAGGLPISETEVLKLIRLKKIPDRCLDSSAVSLAIITCNNGEAIDEQVIAQGIEPVDGTDAEFLPLVEKSFSYRPQIDEDDIVDYFETHTYIVVNPGDRLMRRKPATEGTDGINVQGKELKAKQGDDTGFSECEGAEISPDNPNILIASEQGHPVIEATGVAVQDTLQLKNADLESGNITFKGSVFISGDVASKVKINVSGDVYIKGTVENANIIAGNDIVVGKGVISEQVPTEDNPPKLTTYLEAGGNVRALFFNQTRVVAKKEISAQRYAMHCDLHTEETILMGENGGKGVLIGGSTFAKKGMECNIIGSEAYVKTEIVCAPITELNKLKKKYSINLERRENEAKQLTTIFQRIKEQNKTEKVGRVTLDKAKKLHNTINHLNELIEKLRTDVALLDTEIISAQSAIIQVNRKLYPNTMIELNDKNYHCKKERNKVTIKIDDDALTFE